MLRVFPVPPPYWLCVLPSFSVPSVPCPSPSVYPHRRIYVVFPLVPPPFRKRSPVFELRATQNQQLSGTGFGIPKSTVFGTIVPLRMYVSTYIINLLKVTPKLHSGGNSLGEISGLLRLSKTTVHQLVKVPAESSEAFTRIIISGFMRHR